MSNTVETKPKKAVKAKRKADSKMSPGKKASRGLKEATKTEVVEEVVSNNVETTASEAPVFVQREVDFAERMADAIVVSWNRFVRSLPRLVWVGQRINVTIRLTDNNQVGAFYHSKHKAA